MRYFEIAGGLRVHVSEEEQELIEASTHQTLDDDKLDERQQEVARKMVSRGLLIRHESDDKLYYTANGLPDIWRF